MRYHVDFCRRAGGGWSAWLASHPQFTGEGDTRAAALQDVRGELFAGLNGYVIEHECLPRPDAIAAAHMIELDFGLVADALTPEALELLPKNEPVGI